MRDMATIVEFWTGGPKPSPDGVRLIAARSIAASKAAIRAAFPSGLVNDPVVEIMMAVYIADATTGQLSLDSACAVAGNTPAVARRWVLALEQEGLVRLTTGAGGRWVSLTDKGFACATQAIDGMLDAQAAILG